MSSKPFLPSFITKVLLPIAIIAAAITSFIYLKESKPEVPAKPIAEQVFGVSSHLVKLQNISPEITVYGAVEARQTVQLSATVNAFVNAVNVGRGDRVSQGQLLVQLDDRELHLTIAQRRASLQDVEARITSEINSNKTNQQALIIEQKLQAINQTNLERQQQLVTQNLAPSSRLEDASRAFQQQQLSLLNRKNTIADHPNRMAQLQTQMTQSEIQLEFALLDLQRTHITAPFKGRVLSVDTASGNRVRNGDRVVKLYNTQSLEVRSQIPARYLPMMQTTQSSHSLSASIFHNGSRHHLIFDRLSAEASASQGGIDAFFSLEEGQNIEVGRNLQIHLKLPEETNVAALPALAIYGQNRIYRIVDERLQAVTIQRIGDWTSPTGQRLTLVRSAQLNNGDQVLITQLPNAVTGLLVEAR
ncbi:MAG: HlyD family efflux transporter periplasmic adaptor subunit [Gammaproteobacteria bacterium]|nr:HlyD family efflux transporter periplasmic adaptor subunit [Gammaproteobacteria bacterium]